MNEKQKEKKSIVLIILVIFIFFNVAVVATDYANAFKVEHDALSLTADILIVDNRALIEAALTVFENLSEEAQASLESEKTFLNNLMEKIIELENESANITPEQKTLIFKAAHADALALNIESVAITDKEKIETALVDFKDLSENIQSLLENEKTFLDDLMVRIVELENKTDTSTTKIKLDDEADKLTPKQEAEVFRIFHANTLALTVETVKMADRKKVEATLKAFENLSKETQTCLESEKTHLVNLITKISELDNDTRYLLVILSIIIIFISLPICTIFIIIPFFGNICRKKNIINKPETGVNLPQDMSDSNSPDNSECSNNISHTENQTELHTERPKGIVLLDKKPTPIIEVEESTENVVFVKHKLIFEIQAVQELKKYITWGKSNSTNENEQQGILVGKVIREIHGGYTSRVERVILSKARGNAAYIETSHSEWNEMDKELNKLNEGRNDAEKYLKVGWWHTHPNMGIFMSGTDRDTQIKYYNKDWQFAVVLNPQEQRWGVFVGANAIPCKGTFLK